MFEVNFWLDQGVLPLAAMNSMQAAGIIGGLSGTAAFEGLIHFPTTYCKILPLENFADCQSVQELKVTSSPDDDPPRPPR